MPEISRFLGMVIYMYFNDHNPPHIHVKYEDYRATLDITSLSLTSGKLPSRVLGLVIEWAEIHQQELLANWHSIRTSGEFHKIKPLV